MNESAQDFESQYQGLTRHFAAGDAEALVEVLVPASVSAGERLIRRGSVSDTMYLVDGGLLSISIGESGQELELGQSGPGSFVGELGMIEPGPASATVVAVEDTSLLTLDHGRFVRFTRAEPTTASAVLQALAVDLVQRLRASSVDLLEQIDEGHWMQAKACEDRRGWLDRLAILVVGDGGDA